MTPQISIAGVGRAYGSGADAVVALEGVTLDVAHGEFLCVVGPSGCGKSTLLRILAGLYEQSSGTIEIAAGPSGRAPRNAVVFQEYALFPWRSIVDNVAFGLEMQRVPKAVRVESAMQHLENVDLTEFADRYPHELSGGMKQRVAIARAFATDPDILLMDEPFGALDAQTRRVLQQDLLDVWRADRKTVVYVTHSIDEAILLGDRVAVMTKRPGRIKAEIDIDIPRPREFDVRTSLQFNELEQMAWKELRDEVDRTEVT